MTKATINLSSINNQKTYLLPFKIWNKLSFWFLDGVIRGPLTFASALGTRFMPMENISMADQVSLFWYFHSTAFLN